MGGVAPGVALGDTPHECPVAVVGNTFPFATGNLPRRPERVQVRPGVGHEPKKLVPSCPSPAGDR